MESGTGPGAQRGGVGRNAVGACGLLLAVLTGCSTGGGLFGGNSAPASAPRTAAGGSAVAAEPIAAEGLGVYLELMRRLVEGDPLTQSETFNTARDNAEYAPTKINRLSYALALSLPGHPGFDAEAAASLLRALIASGPTLDAGERALAEIQLHQVEAFMRTEDNRQALEQELATAAADAAAQREAAVAAGVQPLAAENERLRTELEAAEAMLEALTSIEESLSESQQP